jgi:hypothetical protein
MKRIVLVLALLGVVGGVSSPSKAEAGGYYARRPFVNAPRLVPGPGLWLWNRLYYSHMYIPRPPSTVFGNMSPGTLLYGRYR